MSINDIPEEVLSMIFKMMDLKDLTNIFVKVSKKWMNIIAFMIIHPILKTRNRGLAQKFEENGWSCDDANFILVLFENQEKLSKVHDQMMMKASGPLDWTMSSLPSRSRSTQRQWFAKVLLLCCNFFQQNNYRNEIKHSALHIFREEYLGKYGKFLMKREKKQKRNTS